MTDIDGRRVIITGGASGIGRATAELLAERGARVVALDVDTAAGAGLVRDAERTGVTLSFVRADITDRESVAAAVDGAVSDLGGLDVLISAAGIMRGQLTDIADVDPATWAAVIDVNLSGAFNVAQRVAPIMSGQGSGVILLVASKAGVTVGSGSYAYGSSKGGVHGLALTLDRHLSPDGVRVNLVCPGDVDTPLYRASIAEGVAHGGDEEAANAALARLVSPRSIAEVLAFLASEAATAVRGTVMTA